MDSETQLSRAARLTRGYSGQLALHAGPPQRYAFCSQAKGESMKVTVTDGGRSSSDGSCIELSCGCLIVAIALAIVAGALKSCGL